MRQNNTYLNNLFGIGSFMHIKGLDEDNAFDRSESSTEWKEPKHRRGSTLTLAFVLKKVTAEGRAVLN